MNTPTAAISLDINGFLAEIARNRPIFHSEADFQHAFAWEAHRRFPDALIRLERPISTNSGVMYLDVLIQRQGVGFAIELKYKTRSLSYETHSEAFSLRNHGAQDIGRYDFIKDISRLEEITSSGGLALGYAVLLTNDSTYWRSPSKATIDAAFRLHESRVLAGEVAWENGASEGTMKSREEPIRLRGSYLLHWEDYSSLPVGNGSVFRYLTVAVGPNIGLSPGGFAAG